MILGNPSTRRDSFFVLPLLIFLFLSSISSAQGVYGYIHESLTRHPLRDAQVGLYQGDALIVQTVTDSNGFFNIRSTIAGRFMLSVKAADYIEFVEDEIILDGYATHRIDYELQRDAVALSPVRVVSQGRRFVPSVILIQPDEMLSVAGNFEDPVRILHSQPGVVLLNDQSNQFALRGQSPMFNTWQLEGLEIANPSHTSNAGTLSDRPTQSGGGINMFSAQMLGSTVVHTGLNPLSTGRTAGAVINMHLHETTKPEWRARAGLIGLELGGGVATGAKGVLDFNLRYSFTGLLANLGVDFGGEKIGFYDGVISYLHRGKSHKLKVFFWTGSSKNEFEMPETPERIKDFYDITYENDIRGIGLRFDHQLSDRAKVQSGIAYSNTRTSYLKDGEFEFAEPFFFDEGYTRILSSFASIVQQLGNVLQASAGIEFVRHDYLFEPFSFYYPFTDISRLRPNLNLSIQVNREVNLELGGDVIRLSDDEYHAWKPGGRAVVKWHPSQRFQVFAGVRSTNSHYTVRGPVDATTFETGATYRTSNHVLTLTAYAQQLDDVYGAEYSDGSGYIHMADFLEPVPQGLAGDFISGRFPARYAGIEGKWLFSSTTGWSWQFNQSLYDVKRGRNSDELVRGRFDGEWASHVMLAKSWVATKNEKQRTWNIALRGIFNGGLWEETIDEAASDSLYNTVYAEPGNFSNRLPAFKRIDLSISRTTGLANSRWRWMLDIQNAFGFTNIAYHYYDPFLNRIEAQEHLGIIPVLSLQISW